MDDADVKEEWDRFKALPFPESIKDWVASHKEPRLMLAITYAAGHILAFIRDGVLSSRDAASAQSCTVYFRTAIASVEEDGRDYLSGLLSLLETVQKRAADHSPTTSTAAATGPTCPADKSRPGGSRCGSRPPPS